MAEPSLERLNRFTPDAGRLDRDTLLFTAGRRSARPNRGWIALATLLAASQSMSLLLLWTPSATIEDGRTLPITRTNGPGTALEPRVSTASSHPVAWGDRLRLRGAGTADHPHDDVDLVENEPPLQVFPLRPALLN